MYDQCIDICNSILKEKPNNSGAYQFLSTSYAAKGMYEESRLASYQTAKLTGNAIAADIIRDNNFDNAIKKLMEANGPYLDYIDPIQIAQSYAFLKDNDNTFKYLNKALERKTPQISLLNTPLFDFLRQDPRYNDIFERAGFKEYFKSKNKKINRLNF
jgi:hypothetical protein